MKSTSVDLDFADGNYTFALPIQQVLELERKCGGKSIFKMYDEIGAGLGINAGEAVYMGGGGAMFTDIRETIRLALIGGNSATVNGGEITVGPRLAVQLVDDYTYPARPLVESQRIAWAILNATIEGIVLKKKAEPAAKKPRSRSAKVKS